MFSHHIYSPVQQLKNIFEVFRKPDFSPSNSEHRNVLWQKAALARMCMPACQLAKCGRSPSSACLEVPRVQLGNALCLFWMCEAPVKILCTCLGLNTWSYALPTSFSLHGATSVETCNPGLVLSKKIKENNLIHH